MPRTTPDSTTPVAPIDHATSALRDAGHEPIRIWRARPPKAVGGEVSAHFLQDTNAIVLTHVTAGGKVAFFRKVELGAAE